MRSAYEVVRGWSLERERIAAENRTARALEKIADALDTRPPEEKRREAEWEYLSLMFRMGILSAEDLRRMAQSRASTESTSGDTKSG